MDNKNKNAFPVPENHYDEGLTKREYFAAMAMQGLLANHWCQNDYKNNLEVISPEHIAQHAAAYADAILKELEK